MRKQFFLLTLFLCLCVNIAWGQTWGWTTETPAAGSFYLFNKGQSVFLKAVNTTTANVDDATLFTLDKASDFSIAYDNGMGGTHYVYESNATAQWGTENSKKWKTTQKTGGYNIWHEDPGKKWYETANRVITIKNNGSPYVDYPKDNDGDNSITMFISPAQKTARQNYLDQYAVTESYADNGSNPTWVRNYASRLLSENNAADYASSSTKITNLQAYTHFATGPIADMTELIANPNFENSTWNYGWSGTGSNKAQAFVNQSGNANFSGTFAEMWKNNKLEADGNIYQSITLPAGLYKLKAKVVSTNIYSSLYAIVGGTEYNDWFTGSDASAYRAIVFYVPSEMSVQIGYKTRNYDSSASSSTWTAVDDFTLTLAEKLDLTISGSNIAEGTFFVDEEIASGFSFAYNDGEVAVPTPTLGSSSSDFYYTITTNSISSIKTGCDGGHTSDVITYDPSTNQLKAWNAGTATITFHHNSTSIANEAERSFNVVVSKIANPITVTLDGESRNAKNIGFNTNVTLAYSSPSDVEYIVNHRDGSSNAVTLAGTILSSSTIEGIDYWDISQAENYKYEAGSAFVRIQVNEVPETESYLYTALTDGSNYNVNDGNYEINLSYSPLEIRYRAKRDWGNVANIYCTWYDANGNQLGQKKEDLSDSFDSFARELPENTRKIIFSKTGTGKKLIDNIYVVRRTFISAVLVDEDLGDIYVGNNESTTLNVDWGTSNGGNLSVESNNSHFAVSAASIETSANSNGSTTLTVTYTPDNTSIGEEEATISIRDTYHYTYVTIRATAIKQKALVYGYGLLYSSSKNIQIDDAGTEVYDATFNAMNNEVTLNKLTASNDKAIIIPANNVVLLYKADYKELASSTIDFEYTTTETNVSIAANNCFVHHDGSATGYANYLLGEQGGVVAFHLFTGAESELANYNVLQLPISPSPAPSAISIVTEGNTATALVPVYEDNSAVAGQKANGKKILIEGRLYIQQGNNLYDALGRKVQ